MALFDFLFGKPDQQRQQNILTPEQQEALQRYFNQGIEKSPLYGAGSNYLQNLLGGGEGAYSALEGPLMQQFQQQIVPGLAERFAGMGTGAGAGNSSAFYNSLGQAGKDLSTNLGALRGGLQMQGLGQALNYAQQPYSNTLSGLGVRSFIPQYQQGNQGFLGNILGGIGAGFGGPFGSALGSGLGSGISGLFR